MLHQLRRRITYANVMATIAVFGVLAGGGAYAASKIGPKDIKKNAVRAKHIKKDQVRAKHNAGAFARVRAGDGGPPVIDARVERAKGIRSADVTQVNSSGSFSAHFCFRLGFKPRHVQATIAYPSDGAVITAALPPDVADSCPASHDDASATAKAIPGGFYFDRDFYISFDR